MISLKSVSIGIMVIVAFLSGFFTANISQGLWAHTATTSAPKVSVTFLYNRSGWKQPNEMAIVLHLHDSANKSYEETFYLRSDRTLTLQLEQGKTYEYEVVFLKDQFNLPQSMKFYGNRDDFAYVTWEEWVEILDRGKFVASDGLEVKLNMPRYG